MTTRRTQQSNQLAIATRRTRLRSRAMRPHRQSIGMYRVTLSDERLYCFNLEAASAEDAIDLAQTLAEEGDNDPRLRELGGSFHEFVSCVELPI